MGELKNKKIEITSLDRIRAEGGDVLHALKSSDTGFVGFGEAYFSLIGHNKIKAWKRHKKMTMNLIVPYGQVKFVFLEPNLGIYQEENAGEERYIRITVPSGVWFGFQGLSKNDSLVLNIASIPHDTQEIEKKPLEHFKYNWKAA